MQAKRPSALVACCWRRKDTEHRVKQKERKIAKFWELVLKYIFVKELKALTETQMDETGTSWGNKGRILDV